MMSERERYLNVKSSYVRIFFSVMIVYILLSFGLTITIYTIYSQYMQRKMGDVNSIMLVVNAGLLGSLLITLLVMLPIALVTSRKIASPLVEMKKVAIAMSEGNFSVRANDGYKGEMGQLASTLNQLSAELYKTIDSLTIERNLLMHILNSMSDGLLGFDLNQKINLSNSTFAKMFSIEGNIENLPKDLKEKIYELSKATIEERVTQTCTCQYEKNSILISCSPIRSEDKNIVGTVMIFHDVTEATRLEQTRRDYVANVSHELRSPLTSMKGLIIPLKEDMVKDEKRKKHFYDIICNEVERLNRLVNDLFELSRLQSDNFPFEMQEVDIVNILYDQQDKFELLAEEKNISLSVQTNTKSLYAKGNIDRIGQVLTILIDNALKFAREKSVITLSAKENENIVTVSIYNTGSGIDKGDLPLIFDRFYKVDKAHKGDGAGLGLSIAKEVITRMNGKIYAESDGENETTFTFELEAGSKIAYN